MDNLIFSFNIVFPLFLLMLIGFIMGRKGLMTNDFCSKATTLVFYFALPASLFLQVAKSDIQAVFNLKFVLFSLAAAILLFLLSWLVIIIFIKDRSQISAAVHGAFRGNFAYVGLPVISMIMNSENLTASAMIITFIIPLYNILAIVVLSYYNTDGKRPTVGSQLLAIIKNPLIIGILLAIPFSYFQLTLPSFMDTTLTYLGRLATPLALLIIGATQKPAAFKNKPLPIFLAAFIKIVFAPLVFTLAALPFGFTTEELVTLYTFFAVPSAANSYIMTRKMGGDGEIGAGIVMITSLGSVLTLTLGIFLLKTFGLI